MAKVPLGDNSLSSSSMVSNDNRINFDMKISKKEARYAASLVHGERQRDTSTTSKPAANTKWSDARKHENLFSRVPIFKSGLDARSYYFHDVTVEDLAEEERI